MEIRFKLYFDLFTGIFKYYCDSLYICFYTIETVCFNGINTHIELCVCFCS